MAASKNTSEYAESPRPVFRYAAFISYRHVDPDRKWAKWLHAKLESYRIPKQLIAGNAANRLGRAFRDEEELPASSDLSREINSAIEQSHFLIVICSPRTPESKWVNQEIVRFRELGRHDQILALLIEGEPKDAFPDALREIRSDVTQQSGLNRTEIEKVEPLAADVRAIAGESKRSVKRLAFLRLAAALLGRRFDDLKQRDQERKTRRLLQLIGALSFLMIGVGLLAFFAFYQKQAADHQRAIAEARMLVSQGEAEFEGEPLIGLRVAAEGLARVPDGEDDLVVSLSNRVAAKAAEGRVMKISGDVAEVYQRLPEFPYVLLQNRYSPSTLLHAADLKVVAKFGDLFSRNPLKVTTSLEYFAVSQNDADPRHVIWRTSDGRSMGRTNTLSNKTLMPHRNPIYYLRDVGFSPLLQRLTDSTRLGRDGFDIRRVAYEPGARAFALFYRDDENTRIPPPPDLFDLNTGAVLKTLPRDTSNVFFDRNGSPYYVLVIGDAHWQLRRTDVADQVIIESEGSPNLVSFGDDVSAGYWLLGFWDGTEIRRIQDGGLIDRIDESLRAASTAADGISWVVQMRDNSTVQLLSLDNDRLRLHALADDGTEVTTAQLFVVIASAAPLNALLRDRPTRHHSVFNKGIHEVTEHDKRLRASVWRRGKNNRPVYFKEEQPQDLEFLNIKRFYSDRDRKRDSLFRSELRRTSDDSLVFGRNDEIRRYGADPSRNYVWMQVADPEDDEDSEVVLVRFADGKVIWEGEGVRISFAPYEPADYFFVWTGSGQDQLRNLADGAEITSLGGALRHLDFRPAAKDGYFVAAFKDGHNELWDSNSPPTLLRSFGFGLRGYLSLPNRLMLIWYDNGNAYVIDLAWLARIRGDPGSLPTPELLDSLCSGLFAKSWFDRQAWASRTHVETRACVH